MMKRLFTLLVLCMVFLLAACSPSEPAQDTPDSHRDTLTIASQLGFNTFDPCYASNSADMAISFNIFDGLLNMDPQGNTYPLLATDWDISEDGTEYTFYLREDVKFHNGADMNADDVVYSLNRAMASPYMALFTQYMDHVEKIDEFTVKIVLKAPSAPFLSQFAYFFAVLDQETTEQAGDSFKDEPIGCGAYQLVSASDDQSVTLQAFDGYYGGAPTVKTLIYKVIPDPSTALIALETGEIDVCSYIPAASIEIVEANKKLSVSRKDTPYVSYLSLNTAMEPLDNVTLRQAMGFAIDRQSIVDIVFEGQATVAYSLINDMYVAYPEELEQYGYSYDPDKAKELLAQAGYPDGMGLPDFTITSIENYSGECEIVQFNLTSVGIPAKIELVDISAYTQLGASGGIQLGYMSIGLGNDAAVFVDMLTKNGAYNVTQYGRPEIDELFAQGAAEQDLEKRREIYLELYKMVNEDAPYLPTHFLCTTTCTQKDVDLTEASRYLQTKGMYYHFQ